MQQITREGPTVRSHPGSNLMVPKDMLPATDIDLIKLAQSGNLDAFEQLIQRYDRKVFSLAATYVHSADDAKDIFQEVFIRVYRGLPQFELRSEFSTWLYRIATNVCLSHRTRAKRHHHSSIQSEGDDEDGVSHGVTLRSTDKVDRTVEDADLHGHIKEALQELSPRQRLVFLLKHYEEFKLREIAQMTGLSEGTVKKYLFEATSRIRTRLSPHYARH